MIDLRKPPVLVLATNPWLSGKLYTAAKKAGVNIKKFWYFRNPPPWSRYREYKEGASKKQIERWEAFATAARKSAKQAKLERGKSSADQIAERIKLMRQMLKTSAQA